MSTAVLLSKLSVCHLVFGTVLCVFNKQLLAIQCQLIVDLV